MITSLPKNATPGALIGGKYRVERVLGQGGMGVVLLATHVELGTHVAVKMLLAEADAPAVARFRREAQVAARLSSPHIARVLDFGTSDEQPFLVMEYLEGHDLDTELLRRRRLPIAEAVDYVLEACVGLAQAHASGLVHRDLKPANLFLAVTRSARRTVKVLDFGLTKDGRDGSAALTGTAEVFGTPQFMAPEQIQSTKNVDARCDQHALGAILFELCSGRPAYVAESVTQLIVVIATHPPPSLLDAAADAPPELDRHLRTALAKRPEDRFPDLGAFAAALRAFGSTRAAELCTEIDAALGGASAAYAPTSPPAPQHVRSSAAFASTRAAASLPALTGDPRSSALPAAPVRAAPSSLIWVGLASAFAVALVASALWWTRPPAVSSGSALAPPIAVGVPTTSAASPASGREDDERAMSAPSAASAAAAAPPRSSTEVAISAPVASASSPTPRPRAPAPPPIATAPTAPSAPRPQPPTCMGLNCY